MSCMDEVFGKDRVESEPELDDLAKQVAQTMWGYPPTW